MSMRRALVYTAAGPVLTARLLDPSTGTLVGGPSTRFPADVQYAWPHASGRTLYVASSGGTSRPDAAHHLTAARIAPATGALTPIGAPVALPARPIHVCVDPASRNVLVAFNSPAALRVYRIADDSSVVGLVDEAGPDSLGVFPHQVRVTPDGQRVVVACRGYDAAEGRSERPGSLRIISYHNGRLGGRRVVAPHGGYGFGPRDVDFHPGSPWLYLSLERQNVLAQFGWRPDGELEEEPRHVVSTLASPPRARQLAGPVHVHPRGHVAYVVNRTPSPQDKASPYSDGENTIAVYSCEATTGRPRLIQHVDTAGIHCRTFQLDPTGSLLLAAHAIAPPRRQGPAHRAARSLSVFRVDDEGRLTLLPCEQDLSEPLFWMGIVDKT